MRNDHRLYKEMNIWRRLDESTLIRYRCFHVLPDNKYCVQSADFYRYPLEQKNAENFSSQFLELLVEESPVLRRGKLFGSIEDAIEDHDLELHS